MKTLILSLGTLAALALPAAAGRLDNAETSAPQGYAMPDPGIDYGTTASIKPSERMSDAKAVQPDMQPADQGRVFGPNSH